MNPPSPTPDFREQMSAWYDGELPIEAGRFVARRVLDDAHLRAELGRWQRVGDVLRRQPVDRPPADLSQRIAQALPEPRRFPRDAALAAGVALFGLLLWAPLGPPGGAPPGDTGPALTAGAVPASAPPVAVAPMARPAPVEPPLRAVSVPPARAQVPVLVRAPQPSPEQLAPLPPIEQPPEPPARPWPRGEGANPAFVVDYRMVPPSEGR